MTTSPTPYNAGGRHDLRLGGEFLNRHQIQANCRQCSGDMRAQTAVIAPRPEPGADAGVVPGSVQRGHVEPRGHLAVGDARTTSASATSTSTSTRRRSRAGRRTTGRSPNRLTLNLGAPLRPRAGRVRQRRRRCRRSRRPGVPPTRPTSSRASASTIRLNDKTGIRGGSGLYYGDALGADQSFATGNAQIVVIQYTNDGRPDFAANPTNGQPLPTTSRRRRGSARAIPPCSTRGRRVNYTGPAPCLTRDLQEFVGLPKYVHLPRTFQTSIGMQHQFGSVTAFTADYVYSKGTHEKDVVDNINLTFNPATGVNFPFANRATRPVPGLGRRLDEHAPGPLVVPRACRRR